LRRTLVHWEVVELLPKRRLKQMLQVTTPSTAAPHAEFISASPGKTFSRNTGNPEINAKQGHHSLLRSAHWFVYS